MALSTFPKALRTTVYVQFTPLSPTQQNCRVLVASGGVNWIGDSRRQTAGILRGRDDGRQSYIVRNSESSNHIGDDADESRVAIRVK